MNWPAGADGDVFRRLQSDNFDFTISHKIDFQIDFDPWPPQDEVIATLDREYKIERHEPQKDALGYIQITIVAPLTYDLVMGMQDKLSRQLSPFGGFCESWGILS